MTAVAERLASPKGEVRRVTFEHAVAGVILANTAILLAGLMVDGHEEWFEIGHNACLAFFVFELALRLRASRWQWNVFDALVIALSLMPMLGVEAALLRVARLARLVHFARHISHLRLLTFFVRASK